MVGTLSRTAFSNLNVQQADVSLSRDGGPSFVCTDWLLYTYLVMLSSEQFRSMSHVTHILSQIESGDPSAAEKLLPLIYDELRNLAAQKMALEYPGQTLQATALVHEAYIRLVDTEQAQHWNSRGHLFAATAEAMRRILVENARRKVRVKHGDCRAQVVA